MMLKITQTINRKVNQSGSAVVEFALLIFLLLIIVAGIVEFGRAIWYYDALSKATRDSARYLSNVRESQTVAINATHRSNAVGMVRFAASEAKVPGFRDTYVTVSCNVACSAAAPEYVNVKVSYPITLGEWIPFLVSTSTTKSWRVTLSPETTMRYMR